MTFAVSASATQRGIEARMKANPARFKALSPPPSKLPKPAAKMVSVQRIESTRDMKAALWFLKANQYLDLLQHGREVPKFSSFRQTMARIIRRICRATGIPEMLVRGEGRNRELVRVRYACVYWCRRLTGQSLPLIAQQFGDRDHTTILYAIRGYPKRRAAEGRHVRTLCVDPGDAPRFAPREQKERP